MNSLVEAVLSNQDGFRRLMTEAQRQGFRKDRAAADQQQTTIGMTQDSAAPPFLVTGTVTAALPSLGWYRVTCGAAQGSAQLICNRMHPTAVTPIGAREIEPLAVGNTNVVVLRRPKSIYGTIIGVLPDYVNPPDTFLHPDLAPGTGTSNASDKFVATHLKLDPNGLVNYSNGAPQDVTMDARGHVSPSGPAIFSDSFSATLRADIATGFFAYSIDQTARMVGRCVEIWSDALSITTWNDQDAASAAEGISLFSWEALGYFGPSGPATVVRTREQVQITDPGRTELEPASDAQIPFQRIVTYSGYLGYGRLTMVYLPPAESASGFVVGGQQKIPVVGIDHLGIDGSRYIGSASGIMLAHIPVGYAPVLDKRPFDPTGLVRPPGELVGAGQQVGGLAGTPPIGTGIGLSADDEVAYAAQWRPKSAFKYDEPDWHNPVEEAAAQEGFPEQLMGEQFNPLPEPTTRSVDHRHAMKYFDVLSFVRVTHDGRVVIAGPNGEEIRMGGGTLELHAPGDIVLRAGRNITTMSGRDTSIRAYKSAELVSATEEIRVKGDRDVQILAGNSGMGTLLLESRSEIQTYKYTQPGNETSGGGVVIKSSGLLALTGQAIYARSTNSSITLDASQGAQDIAFVSRTVSSWVSQGMFEYFGERGDVETVGYRLAGSSVIPGTLAIENTLTAGEDIVSGRNLFAVDTVAAGTAKDSGGKLASLQDESLDNARKAADNASKAIETQTKAAGDRFDKSVEDVYYATEKIGEELTGNFVTFRFKTSEQYGTDSYVTFESRWAQHARVRDSGLLKWTEPEVNLPVVESGFPFPGAVTWQGESYLSIDPTLYDPATGLPRGLDSGEYEKASYSEPSRSTLQGAIPII